MGNSGQEGRVIDGAEVAKHSKKGSCWIVLDSNVYDVTSFLGSHPGGAAILLKQGGGVSTAPIYHLSALNFTSWTTEDAGNYRR